MTLAEKYAQLRDYHAAVHSILVWQKTGCMVGRQSRRTSKPPADVNLIDVLSDLDRCLVQVDTALFREFRERPGAERLRYLAALRQASGAYRAVDAALSKALSLCGRVLGLNDHIRCLGPCPRQFRDGAPVAWADGEAGAILETDRCIQWDAVESARETRRTGRNVEVWVTSPLLVDSTADPATSAGDIWCSGCGHRWPAREWLALRADMLAAV